MNFFVFLGLLGTFSRLVGYENGCVSVPVRRKDQLKHRESPKGPSLWCVRL